MRFDLRSQMILSELKHLYDSNGSYGLYTMLYDFLVNEGHDFGIDADKKAILWKKSVDRFNVECKSIINRGDWSKEMLTKELHKFYKSALAADYLLRVKRDTGMTLDITDEQGNKLHLLTMKPYED